MAEETSPSELMTPSKLSSSSLPVLTTPTGGLLYNPFHEDYVARLGEATVTPGLFAPPNKSATRDEATKPIPFIWSPEVKGDHFPTEIDENPTYQLRMQQELDADVEEVAQTKITKFFQSNVVAPSPDVTKRPPKENFQGKPALPRTSSLKPLLTSGSGSGGQTGQRTVVVADVEVQTSISVAPDTDLSSLLHTALEIEEKENVDLGTVYSAPHRCGVFFSEAIAKRTENPYPRYSNAMCHSCLQGGPTSNCRFDEASDMDTLKMATSFSDEDRNIHNTLFASAEDLEAVADDLGLPVSWASESVSLNSLQQNSMNTENTSRFHQNTTTNLTGLLEKAGIGSCRTPSPGRRSSRLFESVSPLVGGRTSPEARGLQRPLPLSLILDDEDEDVYGSGGVVEESTRDSSMPLKRQCSEESRRHGMASPNLSPIYCSRDYAPMDHDYDDYVDVDALPATVVNTDHDGRAEESAP